MNADDVKPKTDETFTPPSDPSQYIRTYAKDVAQLSKLPPPNPSSAAQPAAPSPKDTTSDGVTLPEFDASPVDHKNDPASPKEFEQETVALSKEDSDGVFATSPVQPVVQSVPLMPQASIGVLPDVPQQATVTAPPDPEREAVLARLRAKLASHTPPPAVPAPPPVPEPVVAPRIPEPESLRTAAPVFSPPEASFAVPLPQIVPVAKPPQVPVPPQATAQDSPLHTFSSDFADRIDAQRASTFSVLAAETNAPARPRSAPKRRIPVQLIAGIALLVAGIGIVAGTLIYMSQKEGVPVVAGVPSLIAFDESVEVTGSGPKLMQALADVAGDASVPGNVIVTYVTLPSATGGTTPQPGGALIAALQLPAPDILLRNIDESSTVGVVHAGSESRPFFILRVNSYERTFAGMLAWEPALASDLATLFPQYPSARVEFATTSATSTAPAAILAPASPFFADAVVANHDVRVLRNASGQSLLLYGYHGKDTLVIARDEEAFTALIARLAARTQ